MELGRIDREPCGQAEVAKGGKSASRNVQSSIATASTDHSDGQGWIKYIKLKSYRPY